MNEFFVLKKDTPHIRAKRISRGIAEYPGMPKIYHKEFDLHEFIGEELAGIRGVNSVHYFPVLFDDIDNVMLEVNENNIPAISLYKKNKFEIINKRNNYYGSDAALIMKRVVENERC